MDEESIKKMDRRSTKKYGFQIPRLEGVKRLADMLIDREGFRRRHGFLLSILDTKFDVGILKVLVQFYDPWYHCFTFPDYQLVPTLEEYSHLVGLPVLDSVPFTGLDPAPSVVEIATALHLKNSNITSNITTRDNISGLTSKFLIGKANMCASTNNLQAFESILALLIYGLVLFPNVEGFVDMNAIQIFLSKNPVPTLLANTYHSIHYRTQKGDGTILCCAPLLYLWYTMHLPLHYLTKPDPDRTPYSDRILSLTPDDIIWYNPACDPGLLIDRCGKFQNVPLIGIDGGISYNPTLARRQFGFAMKEKPLNIYLEDLFYSNDDDPDGLREQFAQAWLKIHKTNGERAGRRPGLVHTSYLQWVIDRAMQLKMPYHTPRFVSATIPAVQMPLPPSTREKYQERLAEEKLVSGAWKRKHDNVVNQLRERDLEIDLLKHELRKKNGTIAAMSLDIQAKDKLLARHTNKRKN